MFTKFKRFICVVSLSSIFCGIGFSQEASLIGSNGVRGSAAGGSGSSLGAVSFTYQTPPRAREFREQDIILVQIKEHLTYNDTADLQRQKKIKSKMKVTDMFKWISPFELPVPSDTAPPGIGGEIDSQNRSKGVLTSKRNLQTTVACQVTAVMPNGTLQISGTSTSGVGDNINTITVSGIVNPRDVTMDNVVDSQKIAMYECRNLQTGTVSDSIRRGYGTKFLDRWMPF